MCLEARGELVELKVRRRRHIRLDHVDDARRVRSAACGRAAERGGGGFGERGRAPRLGDEHLAREVVVPHVEHRVHLPVEPHAPPPRVHALRHRPERRGAVRDHPLDDVLKRD